MVNGQTPIQSVGAKEIGRAEKTKLERHNNKEEEKKEIKRKGKKKKRRSREKMRVLV